MKKIKSFLEKIKHLSKWQIIRLSICLACLIIYFVASSWMNFKISLLNDQLVSNRWSSDGSFGQASIYFTQGTAVTESKIKEFEYRISKALTEDAIDDGTDEEDTIDNWTDCYSSVGSITAMANNKSVETTAIGTGGDFFVFHPVTLITGSYYNGDDLMNDKVVIDENLAWQLFGSNDIIGETIDISGVPHIITGVARFDSDKMSKAAGINGPICFLSYYSLYNYGSVYGTSVSSAFRSSSDTKASDSSSTNNASNSKSDSASYSESDPGAISCYEVVMPNPVDGYARSVLAGKLGMDEKSVLVVDNKERFEIIPMLNVINAFPTRSMRTFNVTFPYWENIARGWEDIFAIIFAIRVICVLVLACMLVYKIVYSYRHKKWTAKGIYTYILDRKYDLESSLKYERDKWRYF